MGRFVSVSLPVRAAVIPPCRSTSIRSGGKSAGPGIVMGMKTSGVSEFSLLLMHVADRRTTL